jgi:hypothetical protein
MTMHINLRLTALFAAAALSGPAAVAVAQTVGGPDNPRFDVPQPSAEPVPATAEAKAAFSILDRPASADDADNALVVRIASQSGIGLDAAGARVVGSVDSGRRVWLIPANGALCLGVEDADGQAIGMTCALQDDALRDGVTIGDGAHVFGLAPDDVTAVRAAPSAASVAHGGEVYTLDPGDYDMTLSAPEGARTFDITADTHGG